MARFSAPKDAVAAVIKLARDCFVFQKEMFHLTFLLLGCFHFWGAIEHGETPDKALKEN